MSKESIPNFNAQGVLPPVLSNSPLLADRSPYEISILELVSKFGSTVERFELLNGFLQYRAALHEIGLQKGFQWIDGSFMENIEMLEERPPRDIDIVTFFYAPSDKTQEKLRESSRELFIPSKTKEKYKVDAHYVQLNQSNTKNLVDQSRYWYSVWSHRRNRLWKGYVEISLNDAEDKQAAMALLTQTWRN